MIKKSLLIGPLPRRQEGISLAFEMVTDAFKSQELPHDIIDLGIYSTNKVGGFTFYKAIIGMIGLVKSLLKLFSSSNVYLLVGFSTFSFYRDLVIVLVAKSLRQRVVLHVHSGGYGEFYYRKSKLTKMMIRKMLDRSDIIIVLGELLRSQFNFHRKISSKIFVVPNGLPSSVNPIKVYKQIDSTKTIKVLYLSNMITSKGYLDCLESCSILFHQMGLSVQYDFCGEFVDHKDNESNPEGLSGQAHFQKRIIELGLEGHAVYHGSVRGTEKDTFLRNAHFMVLPTYYSIEGQPVCIIESLAFGALVISTNYRGIPEQVIDKYNGAIVPPRNPQAIADAINYFVKNPAEYTRNSKQAIIHYEKHFTTEMHTKKIIPLIIGD